MSDPTDYYAQLSREINEGDPDPAERRRRKEARFGQLYGAAPLGQQFTEVLRTASPDVGAARSERWLDSHTKVVATFTATAAMVRLYTLDDETGEYVRHPGWSWWTEAENPYSFLACPGQLPVPPSALVVGW